MRLELIEKLEKVLDIPYKIVDHYAGIRPATVDRRPLIGRHPEHSSAIIFNGFGSKGISLVPIHAKELVANLLEQKELHPEVKLDRF